MKETIVPEELSFLPHQLAREALSHGPAVVDSLVSAFAACPVKRRFPAAVNTMLSRVWREASPELRAAIAERIGRPLGKVNDQAERVLARESTSSPSFAEVNRVPPVEVPELRSVSVSVISRRQRKSRGSESPMFREVYHQLREVSQQERRTQIRHSSLAPLERKLRTRTTILEKAASLGADVKSEIDAIAKLLSALGDFTNTRKL